jgi:phage N-6-adenine-methyltransferase
MIKAASNRQLTADLDETTAVAINRRLWGNTNLRGTQGTGENEWYTPDEYLAMARDVLGAIDLDPACSDMAQVTVRAARYFTSDDDGLKQDWHGRVWLNPPYAQPLIADFVSKMVAERRAGRVTAAVMLTHNYTDTAWFQEAAVAADAICFTRGRVRFINAEGEAATTLTLREALAESKNLNNICFVPPQPRERVPAYIAVSDACLVVLRKSKVFETVIPTKMLEFMSCGRPVILGVGGQAKEILERSQGGICIEPGNVEALCDAILKLQQQPDLRESMGRNGRKYIVENLSRERTAAEYLETLRGLLGRGVAQVAAAA